jgi:ribose 5-phosphate isomerase A
MSTQDSQKLAVARAALEYVLSRIGPAEVLGVGTGSTADLFIDALAPYRTRIAATVASSERSAQRLRGHGIAVRDLNEVDGMPWYVDGADEIDAGFCMIKGGGGALTREKIVAACAQHFVCIADASKQVQVLGRFPLPLEVIPMARALVERELARRGGEARLRSGFTTDNGNQILDVHGLQIREPARFEAELNQIPGVVTVGLFAQRAADVLFLGGPAGVACTTRAR